MSRNFEALLPRALGLEEIEEADLFGGGRKKKEARLLAKKEAAAKAEASAEGVEGKVAHDESCWENNWKTAR